MGIVLRLLIYSKMRTIESQDGGIGITTSSRIDRRKFFGLPVSGVKVEFALKREDGGRTVKLRYGSEVKYLVLK